jgi:methylation protein EvaC
MNPRRICRGEAGTFLSLGKMPLADGFREPGSEMEEFTYELAVALCSQCQMVQLVDVPERERMFHGEYAYYSSSGSWVMRKHFEDFARCGE